MKISFWSPVRSSVGVTTIMACISALSAIGKRGKSILLENHYSLRSLADILMESKEKEYLREKGAYYDRNGMEYLLKRIYSGEVKGKVVKEALTPLLFSAMHYLPQSRIVNKEVFDYEFNLVHNDLFRALEEIADFIFVDTETNQNLSSSLILDDADLIVVNLTQNPEDFAYFFANYESLKEKAVFLIGSYLPDYSWNLAKICKEFHISYSEIGVIPMNLELNTALSQGRLLTFLNLNYYKPSGKENSYFMRYAKRAEAMILRNISTRLGR
ncbi:MAG: hypothetical protein IJ733_02560 [Lachnospiraceae bacterium]|nr:hypothetical protein [Lachnospiraceae bacterium]